MPSSRSRMVRIYESWLRRAPHLVGVTLSMDESLLGLATKSGEAQRGASLGDETLFDLAPIHPVAEGPALAAPIVSGADVRGALALVRAEGAPLISDDDVLTLQGLAEQLAVGLELERPATSASS